MDTASQTWIARLSLFAFISLSLYDGTRAGTCQQFTQIGTYSCPGNNINYTCVFNSSAPTVITLFSGSAFQCATNQILLNQKVLGVTQLFTPMPCGTLSAVTTNISTNGTCYTSVLTIPAVQTLNGATVMCTGTDGVVGSDTLKITTPPGPVGTLTLNSPSVDQLTVAWAPPTTGGVPTSYNVSINDSSNTLVPIPANGPLQNTFTGLTNDTLYTVSVVAINCAGTSNVTSANRRTLAASPSIQVLSTFNPNNTIRQFQISWPPVGGSVTMYTVRVVGNGASVGPTTTTCTTSPCLYVQQVYVPATNYMYTIFVASINGDGVVGSENSINGATTSNISTSVQMLFVNNITISCTFRDGSSHICLVCCSTTPTAPAGSVGYSTTSGPSVSVSIQNLASNLMYYCTAAATNTKSATCVDPVVGNVKVFFSFMTPAITTPPTPSPSPIGAIVGGVVGGVIFLVIVIIIIILIVFIVLKEPKSKTPDDVPLKKRNSSTPATTPSVDRDSAPPRPSRDTPSPPPGPNTEAEYSTVDSSKKPQNQGMVYAEVGIAPRASSQQRKPPPMPSSQQVFYGEVRAQ